MEVAAQRHFSERDDAAEPLVEPGTSAIAPRRFAELVAHLAQRELAVHRQGSLLGWAWPLIRQLAQLAVLVFVFGEVLDLGIEDFAVFVLIGLVAWTRFSAGINGATGSLLANRHLALQPRLPTAVLPIVAVAVPLVDVLFALPILLVLVIAAGELSWQVVLWPAIALVQLALMSGIAWLCAAAAVHARDVRGLVGVALTLLFYLTPVFYGLRSVPDRYEWVLYLNPLTTLVEAYRAVLIGEPGPPTALLIGVCAGSFALAWIGWRVFRRAEPTLADHL